MDSSAAGMIAAIMVKTPLALKMGEPHWPG
jgi:hypothetical protein